MLDGAHRFRACFELGFPEIYIYDEGEVPDGLAKSFTIFHQVQVPFTEIDLAPLVVELNALDFQLPYTDQQIMDFKNMATFDFNEPYEEKEPVDDEPKLKNLTVKMTPEQLEVVEEAIKTVADGENVSEGRALELLCASGISQYPFDGTGDIELES